MRDMIFVKRGGGSGWPKDEMAMEKLARKIIRVSFSKVCMTDLDQEER